MGNKSDEYKKVFDPSNWPMDMKDIPKGMRMMFGIIGFIGAVMALVMGIILLNSNYLIPALIVFLFACAGVGIGTFHIRAAISKD